MFSRGTTFLIDFDSTLVSVESLEELARIALKDDPKREEKLAQIALITERGMNGEMDFPTSLRERLALLSLHKRHIRELGAFLKGSITPSALKHKDWFRAHTPFIHIISGGFTDCIAPITREFGIAHDHIHANTFFFDADGNVTGCDPKNLLAQEKGKERQARALALKGKIVIIGDGMTDYEMKAAYPEARFLYFAEHVQREKVMNLADDILPDFDKVCADT